MKTITMSGTITIQEFEARLEKTTVIKTIHSLTPAEILLSKLDKEKGKFIICKTGKYGISGGQLYFYGSYFQQGRSTRVIGKFDMPVTQKIVLYALFVVVFLMFVTAINWNIEYILIAALLYHGFLFLFYKILYKLSLRIFRKRNDSVIMLLNEILCT